MKRVLSGLGLLVSPVYLAATTVLVPKALVIVLQLVFGFTSASGVGNLTRAVAALAASGVAATAANTLTGFFLIL